MRRGTAAEWTAADPVLASGEWGVETDTLLTKIGDGATPWTTLAYSGGSDAPFTVNEAGDVIVPVDTADGWVVGSDRFDWDSTTTAKNERTFFNKVKGAFRAGYARSQWNDANVGLRSFASGTDTVASGTHSHAEGYNTTASGEAAHAEGHQTTASGSWSHAEGSTTSATATMAHAEGHETTASGQNSHAEGAFSQASGISSHAEGSRSVAPGGWSHAGGYDAVALRAMQHARGTEAFAVAGDAQASRVVHKRVTTDAVAGPLLAFGTAPMFTAERTTAWTIELNRAYKFRLDAVARRTDVAGEAAGWEFSGVIARDATGDPYFVGYIEGRGWGTTGAAAWDVSLSIDATTDPANPFLAIVATGEVGKTIRWVASLDVVEVG